MKVGGANEHRAESGDGLYLLRKRFLVDKRVLAADQAVEVDVGPANVAAVGHDEAGCRGSGDVGVVREVEGQELRGHELGGGGGEGGEGSAEGGRGKGHIAAAGGVASGRGDVPRVIEGYAVVFLQDRHGKLELRLGFRSPLLFCSASKKMASERGRERRGREEGDGSLILVLAR